MSRRALFLAVLLVLAGATAVGLVAAHGNHATVNSQVSANGTVVVERAVLSDAGHLVVRADDGGEPGEVLGHRALDRGRHSGVRVGIDQWADVSGTATVWVVLHGDDGDGEFDDGDDLLYWFDRPAGDRITVARGDAPANVVAGSGSLDEDGLTLEEATLPRDGHLVVYENGTEGSVLGARSLPAGRHTDVTVPVEEVGADGLLVAVHADDGDGEFDAGEDPVVRAGDDPVASRHEPTADVGVTTPESTARPDSDGDSGAGERSDAEAATDAESERPPAVGFGIVATAVVLALLVVRRR